MSDRSATILCVDDEQSILRLLSRQLAPEGYNVLTASSGAEALGLMEQHAVDVILTDQRMPYMSGCELLRAVKEKHPGTVRIVMSGHSDFDSLVSSNNECGTFRFLAKPWEYEQLRELVREAAQAECG